MLVDHSPPRDSSGLTKGNHTGGTTNPPEITQQVFPPSRNETETANSDRNQTERSLTVQAHESRTLNYPHFGRNDLNSGLRNSKASS